MVKAHFVTDTAVVNVKSEQQTTSVSVSSKIIGGRVGVSSYPPTLEHNKLSNRGLSDQHPISAITGLEDSLEQLNDDIIAESERAVAAEENLQDQIDNIDVTDDTYIYEQGIASDTWVINHNLNKFPSITLVDSAGTQFEAKREYNDMNTVTVYLNGASTGKAYLN